MIVLCCSFWGYKECLTEVMEIIHDSDRYTHEQRKRDFVGKRVALIFRLEPKWPPLALSLHFLSLLSRIFPILESRMKLIEMLQERA